MFEDELFGTWIQLMDRDNRRYNRKQFLEQIPEETQESKIKQVNPNHKPITLNRNHVCQDSNPKNPKPPCSTRTTRRPVDQRKAKRRYR